MTDDRSIERAARSFLEPGPTRAPEAAVEAALRLIQTTPQERDLRIPGRDTRMNGLTRFLAVGATAAAVMIAAIAVGPRLTDQGSGAPTPSASTAASSAPGTPVPAGPSLRADGEFEAYRTARNAICSNGIFEMQKADLAGLYDETITPERRAKVNEGAQQVADAVEKVARDLAALEAPPDMSDAHLVDVTHQQDLAAVFSKMAALAKEGKISSVSPLEHALEAIHELRTDFEVTNRLTPCP